MPLIESRPHEDRLETILGINRFSVLDRLKEQQGVSIQSVKHLCHAMRFEAVSMSRLRMETDTFKMPVILYGGVRQRNTGNVLVYELPEDDYTHSVGIGGAVPLIDYCIDPKGVLDLFETVSTSAWRRYAETISFSDSVGDGHHWSVQELIESPAAEVFFHGFTVGEIVDNETAVQLRVFMTLWVDESVNFSNASSAVANPHWNSLENCIANQMNGDYNFEIPSLDIIQHMYARPRDVAPVHEAPIKEQYSTLITK